MSPTSPAACLRLQVLSALLAFRVLGFVIPLQPSVTEPRSQKQHELARPKIGQYSTRRYQSFWTSFLDQWYDNSVHFVEETRPVLIDKKHVKAISPASELKVGVIVVDHGSRRQEANKMLDAVVEQFREVSGYDLVEPAHMELAEPSIATAFGRCVEQGASFIICHPFFLSRGRHVAEDIPTLMEEAASIFPGVNWALSEPLGVQAEIPKLMQSAVSDCLRQQNIASEDHATGPICYSA